MRALVMIVWAWEHFVWKGIMIMIRGSGDRGCHHSSLQVGMLLARSIQRSSRLVSDNESNDWALHARTMEGRGRCLRCMRCIHVVLGMRQGCNVIAANKHKNKKKPTWQVCHVHLLAAVVLYGCMAGVGVRLLRITT